MARGSFGGGAADYVENSVGTRLPGAITSMWTAQTGGTQLTDLIVSGAAATTVTAGTRGYLPVFSGPDGVVEMWADGGGGIRTRLFAYDAARVDSVVILAGFGIDATGVADSTAALQAKIDGAPAGSLLQFPVGVFKFSSLTVGSGKTLAGVGYQCLRDGMQGLNHAGYAVAGNFGGTVLRSTATTGAAITMITAAFSTQVRVRGFVLIGPGTGTSIGIDSGTPTRPVVGMTVREVMVCNFTTCVQLRNLNECSFYDLVVRGAATGIRLSDSANNNNFMLPEFEFCSSVGFHIADNSCISNTLVNPLGQSNTGVSVVLNGVSNVIETGYFENALGTWAVDIVGGNASAIRNVRFATPVDGVRIAAGVTNTQILGPTSASAPPIVNAGTGTFIVGDVFGALVALNDIAGTNTTVIDARNRVAYLPPAGRPLIMNAATGGQGNLVWADAYVDKWVFRKINGDGALRIRDEANARVFATMFPGATGVSSYFDISAVVGLLNVTSTTRPNAANYFPGAMVYDATLGKPIFSNGTAWRDAAGVAV